MLDFSISDISMDDVEQLLLGYDGESTFCSLNGKTVFAHKNKTIGTFFIVDSADSKSILISERPYIT